MTVWRETIVSTVWLRDVDEHARRHLIEYMRGMARGMHGAQLRAPTRVRFLRRLDGTVAIRVTVR